MCKQIIRTFRLLPERTIGDGNKTTYKIVLLCANQTAREVKKQKKKVKNLMRNMFQFHGQINNLILVFHFRISQSRFGLVWFSLFCDFSLFSIFARPHPTLVLRQLSFASNLLSSPAWRLVQRVRLCCHAQIDIRIHECCSIFFSRMCEGKGRGVGGCVV